MNKYKYMFGLLIIPAMVACGVDSQEELESPKEPQGTATSQYIKPTVLYTYIGTDVGYAQTQAAIAEWMTCRQYGKNIFIEVNRAGVDPELGVTIREVLYPELVDSRSQYIKGYTEGGTILQRSILFQGHQDHSSEYILHEIGHGLGLEHTDGGVMNWQYYEDVHVQESDCQPMRPENF